MEWSPWSSISDTAHEGRLLPSEQPPLLVINATIIDDRRLASVAASPDSNYFFAFWSTTLRSNFPGDSS